MKADCFVQRECFEPPAEVQVRVQVKPLRPELPLLRVQPKRELQMKVPEMLPGQQVPVFRN